MDSKSVTIAVPVNSLEAFLILVVEQGERVHHALINRAEEGRTLVP
jgi:hypothetical protein